MPISDSDYQKLKAMDKVLLSGTLYTARDKAHQRLSQILMHGEELPLNLSTTTLYYCGPSPVPAGKICAAIGPTTSKRMDSYTPLLMQHGLKFMLGKGDRSPEIQNLIQQYHALYLVTIGGAAALLAKCVLSFELFCWEELGPEAIYRLEVKDFPAYVRNIYSAL